MINGIRLLQAAETAVQTSAEENAGLIPAQNTDLMWSTLVTGLIVVFLILVILVIFLWGLGKVMNLKKKSKAKETESDPEKAAAPVVRAAPIEEDEYEEEDDGEIIAVIAAAVAAYGEAEGKQYKIASVRKREKALRSNWSAAGISENTRPF